MARALPLLRMVPCPAPPNTVDEETMVATDVGGAGPGAASTANNLGNRYRWWVGAVGFLLLFVALVASGGDGLTAAESAVLVLAVVLTELMLIVPVEHGSRGYVSLSSVFVFAAFLALGAVAAATINVVAMLIWAVVPIRASPGPPRTLRFLVFNAGQVGVASLLGGVAVWAGFGIPPDSPGDSAPGSVVLFALVAFLVNTALISGAVLLRDGAAAVRDRLWPETTRWTAISLLIATPLALFVVALADQIGLPLAVALVFASLVAVGRLIDLNLRLGQRNADLARATADLRTLNAIGQTLSATLDLDQLFAELAAQVQRVLPTDAFLVALVDREAGVLRFPFQLHGGVAQPEREEPLTGDGGIAAAAVRAGTPIVGDDTESFALRGAADGAAERRFASAVAVPMRSGDTILGALTAKSVRPDAYGPERVALLETVAGQAAVAIRNAQLFRAERAAVEAKQQFLSIVSHELRTPITSITGYSQLLRRRLVREAATGLSDRVGRTSHAEMVAVIEDQARRLDSLVNDLLNLSHLDSGHLILVEEPCDLVALVAEAVADLRAARGESEPPILVDAGDQAPIAGDPVRLRQVLDNLLSNAIKYSPLGEPVSIAVRDEPASVSLVVADRGPGIPAALLDRVLQPFFRVEGADGAAARGLGLGLAICHEIVTAHGGHLSAENAPDGGAVFRVSLPKRRDTTATAATADPVPFADG